MVEAMKKVAELDVELTLEERNLVSVGYRTVIGAKRNFWRTLSSVEHKEWSKENEENVKRIKNYCKRVEDEIAKVCNDILSVIDKHLLSSSHRLPLWNLPYFATHCESSLLALLLNNVLSILGKEIIIAIWQSLVLVLNVRKLEINLLKHIR